ncbi:MAG: phage tail protein [Saprospiraceae bacterium]|nr:phage tail protein [Candidatus Opimibacter iunctus]
MEGYIAQIIMFAGNFAPKFWAFCAGQILSISQNTALFSLLGTTYGGNGQTTFGLPDLRGRVPVGTGQGPGLPNVTLGELSGIPATTLTVNQMPAHNHTAITNVRVSSANTTSEEAAGNILANQAQNFYAPVGTANGSLGGVTTTVGLNGGNQPVNIMQPYLGMNYVICLNGIFPSRN